MLTPYPPPPGKGHTTVHEITVFHSAPFKKAARNIRMDSSRLISHVICVQVKPGEWLSNEKAQMSLLVPSWVPSKIPLTHLPPMSIPPEADLDPVRPEAVAAQHAVAATEMGNDPFQVGCQLP